MISYHIISYFFTKYARFSFSLLHKSLIFSAQKMNFLLIHRIFVFWLFLFVSVGVMPFLYMRCRVKRMLFGSSTYRHITQSDVFLAQTRIIPSFHLSRNPVVTGVAVNDASSAVTFMFLVKSGAL